VCQSNNNDMCWFFLEKGWKETIYKKGQGRRQEEGIMQVRGGANSLATRSLDGVFFQV